MTNKIIRREHILKDRQDRLHLKFGYCLERCPHEGCTALNSPNAAYCHKCGKRLYGIQKTAGVS